MQSGHDQAGRCWPVTMTVPGRTEHSRMLKEEMLHQRAGILRENHNTPVWCLPAARLKTVKRSKDLFTPP
jgi:hypothetical protein